MADGYSTQLQMLIYFRAGCSLSHYTKKKKKKKKKDGGCPRASVMKLIPTTRHWSSAVFSVEHTLFHNQIVSCCFREIIL